MEQDWSTVRGKKYNIRNIKNIRNIRNTSNNYSNNNIKDKEPIILTNINNIVLTEFAILNKFNSPIMDNNELDDGSNLLDVKWNDI